MPLAKRLTQKQQDFCHEYLVDLNATQAAIRAKYSPKTAIKIGSENLTKPDIRDELSRLMENRGKATGVTAERVIRELERIAFFDIRKLYDEKGRLKQPHELDEDTARAIGGIDVSTTIEDVVKKIKSIDKIKALDLLAKHTGVISDAKQNVENYGQVVFVMSAEGRS